MPTQNHTFSPPKQSSSQLTAYWSQPSLTFSAKERDTETGLIVTSLRSVSSLRLGNWRTSSHCSRSLRRFGSRYYSSDLSIWLSVDPQAAKYPGLSPFTYCADNPIKLVDPNGEEIVICKSTNQEGKTVYDIKFTAKIIDKTGKRYDGEKMMQYKNSIKQAIESQYSNIGDDESIVNVDVDIKVGKFDDGQRHNIYLVNNCSVAGRAGEAIDGGNSMFINMNEVDIMGNTNTIGRTAGHEFGHLLNLNHIDDKSNLMNPNSEGTNINSSQIEQAYRNYSENHINKGIILYDYKRELKQKTFMKIIQGKP